MEPKHTPGPWENRVLLVVDASGNQICHCTRWEGRTPHPKVAEANARFISAAPAMAEALEKAEKALCASTSAHKEFIRSRSLDPTWWALCDEAIARNRDAIAKIRAALKLANGE